ncbi:MAG TPA: glycosyltransferase family 2 protein, partial [Patescibacteria group bacterium]|nr:glycosyltransferase family 2 protein [Patescibacteria group bacterium]
MHDERQDVAAVIPAFNEANTIGHIIPILKTSGFFSEVIVVDDGSTDETMNVAKKAGAQVIQLKKNGGKGSAMRAGVEAAHAPIIFFCDADVLGLTREHLRHLITPVQTRELAMCVGIRDRGWIGTWLARHLPLIGGERVLRREIFSSIPVSYLRGFRAELAM